MATYTAQISSLYPIDLAAAVYAGFSESGSQFRIFLSDVAEIPTNPSVRKYVARAALPTCSWSLDGGKVWRQHHIPLEALSEGEFAKALTEIAQSLMQYSHAGGSEVLARCYKLSEGAVHRTYKTSYKWKTQWAPLVAGLIEEIFEQVLNIKIEVEPYWPFRLGQQHYYEEYWKASQRALDKLLHQAKQVAPCSLSFIQGGYISVETSINPSVWKKYSELSFDGELIALKNSGEGNGTHISIDQLTRLRFRFGGPLELIQLQEFGIIVDLPWYAGAALYREKTEDYTGVEFISPIVTNSIERISTDSGGAGYRLSPLGYSLIEFDSSPIYSLIQNKLKTPPINAHDLDDWRQFIYRFPRTSQRLTKHQQSTRAYRNMCEVESKKRIISADLSNIIILERRIEILTPLLFGKYLIELLSLLALLKEWTSPACPKSAPPQIVAFLRLIEWADESDVLIPTNIVATFSESVSVIRSWLGTHGWHFNPEDTEHLREITNILLSNARRPISRRIFERDKALAGFGLAVKLLRDLTDLYYSFAGFCAGAVFKGHILFPFLLLGPDAYRFEIERILSLRGENSCLYFKPTLWSVKEPDRSQNRVQSSQAVIFEDPDE